jgi:serine/threonine protein kinase
VSKSTVKAELLAELAPEFEVLRPLGEGAVGRVVLARETQLKRLVAIKVPRPEINADPIARRRFEREALSAARLTHPNTVTVFRVGHLRDGTPYIVMRYVEGRTLDVVLRVQQRLTEAESKSILQQVASALAEAHGKGIIHRDVRPNNVIWTGESGHAVLMDYGLATIVESGSEMHTQLTRAGQLLGDLAHISPEQLRGEPVTTATDIYSLGILGYELLTGTGPYRVASKAQLGTAHLDGVPERLHNVSPVLAHLLESCLAKRPEHRPTAVDVVRQLARTDGQHHVVHESMPAFDTFLQELKRRRVFNVALLYAGVSFILLQVAQLILPSLPLPAWTYDAIVAFTLAGFPVMLVLSWIFEMSDGRLHRTIDTHASTPAARRTQSLLQMLGVGASLLLAALIGWWILGS